MPLFLQLAPYVLLTLAIAGGGYVFLSLKAEIQRISKRLLKQQQQFEELRSSLATELEGAKVRLQEAEERAGLLVAPPPIRSGFNLSKRSQALRMSRIGEKPENIAAVLGLPRKEVELLMKVQKIVLSGNDIPS